MTILSVSFLALVAAGALVYYLVPKAWRWLVLLAVSLVFYGFAGTPATILYLVGSALTAYGATMWMARVRRRGGTPSRSVGWVTFLALLLNLLVWALVKAKGLWAPAVRLLADGPLPGARALLDWDLVSALGMGYYTLQVIGYIVDCYWETVEPQRNPLKLFLFVCYFPQLSTGPISRYSQLTALWQGADFEYRNLAFGAQRILWGFVKKLVLAERLGLLISGITGNPEAYAGLYSWLVILLYPLQLYADFSGCMDIVLGVSEIYGIHLPENFRNPFFSQSSQEFWQRWHITLGAWAKDYVLYPLMRTRLFMAMGKSARRRWGKRTGRFLVNLPAMAVLWLVMGVWHGGFSHIVGVSLWYWLVLMLGDLFSPLSEKIAKKLRWRNDRFSLRFFRALRTYLIFCVGSCFFGQGVRRGLYLLRDAASVLIHRNAANPWVLFGTDWQALGLSFQDWNVILVVLLLLAVVGFLREKHGYARVWIGSQGFAFRWLIWIGLFVFLLIWGKYGPGYSPAEFIYVGF